VGQGGRRRRRVGLEEREGGKGGTEKDGEA